MIQRFNATHGTYSPAEGGGDFVKYENFQNAARFATALAAKEIFRLGSGSGKDLKQARQIADEVFATCGDSPELQEASSFLDRMELLSDSISQWDEQYKKAYV